MLDAAVADLAKANRLHLEFRTERPSLSLRHGSLLARFRAVWGVHETGGGSSFIACSCRFLPERIETSTRGRPSWRPPCADPLASDRRPQTRPNQSLPARG